MSQELFRQTLLALLSISFMGLVGTLIYVFKGIRSDFSEFRVETNETLLKVNGSIGTLNTKVAEVIVQANTHKDEIAKLRDKTDEIAIEQAKLTTRLS